MVIDRSAQLTREQAAILLEVSTATISRYQKAGILHSIKIGGRVRFSKQEVELVASGAVPFPNSKADQP